MNEVLVEEMHNWLFILSLKVKLKTAKCNPSSKKWEYDHILYPKNCI